MSLCRLLILWVRVESRIPEFLEKLSHSTQQNLEEKVIQRLIVILVMV